ncbi:hypothetical protein, partial [Acetobacterium sp.]|uniref:hypothetical protein n=1 Tax=Acetobacterium sp. TaxID=1872094 RepID=UPI002F41C48F
AKTEAEFDAIVAKLGYTAKADEFKAAFKEAQEKQPISDDQLDQAAGGGLPFIIERPMYF